MATVPYSGLPQVSPEEKAPDVYQRLSVNADMFGGGTARGLQAVGEGAVKASQYFGQVVADNASNEFQTFVTKTLHGDPSQTAPDDGTPRQDTGYLTIEGENALRRAPDVTKAIEEKRKALSGQLLGGEQQRKFDDFANKYTNWATTKISDHANSQAKTWAETVNSKTSTLALTHIANSAENPEQVAAGTADLINARIKQVEVKGAVKGDPVWMEAFNGAKRDALTAQLDAIAVKNPARAMSMLEKNRDIAGLQYDNLAGKYRARADMQVGREAGAEALTTPAPKSNPVDIAAKMVGANEQSSRNVLSSFIGKVAGQNVDPVATPWCAAFANAVLRESGMQGSNSLGARSFLNTGTPVLGNPEQGDVVVLSRGNDPNKGHVGFYAGPGSTPGTVKILGGNQGDAVSYADFPISQILGVRRMGAGDIGKTPQADINAPKISKADAYTRLMDDPKFKALSPEQQAHALSFVDHQTRAQQIAAEETARQRREANDKSADGYVQAMLQGKTAGLFEAIAADPTLDWRTRESLGKAVQSQSGNDVTQATAAYGPGFWDLYKKVIAPPGDPNRIADVTELLDRAGPGGDLTLAGVEKLRSAMGTAQKSVDGHSVQTTKVGLINYAKGRLSFEQDTGPIKIRDPKGEAIFNAQFIPKFEAAYDQWIKAGKNPWEFLTQENVDKIVTGMRSPSEMAQERMRAMGDVPANDPAAGQIPAAPSGIQPKTWEAVMSNRPKTAKGETFAPGAWASAIQMLWANPTPENIALFDNSKFGRAGFKGAEILNKLRASGAVPATNVAPPIDSGIMP